MFLFNFVAQAATISEKCQTIDGKPYCAADIKGFEAVVTNFLNIVTGLGALLALAMLFIGGFKYIMARGDPKATDAARSTITWAVSGLLFVVAAYLVIRLVASFSGVPIETFRIPDTP